MASYNNRWTPKPPPSRRTKTLGNARAVFGLVLAGLGIWTAVKLARKSPTVPVLPSSPSGGALPLGTSG